MRLVISDFFLCPGESVEFLLRFWPKAIAGSGFASENTACCSCCNLPKDVASTSKVQSDIWIETEDRGSNFTVGLAFLVAVDEPSQRREKTLKVSWAHCKSRY